MSDKKIGIKIADGTFFPILEEGTSKRKRLILTTVNDNQESVQIDMYKGIGDEFMEPSYIGSLVIENLAAAEKGTPEIELKIGFEDGNILNAGAKDLASGEEKTLSVSIESLGDETTYDIPEFSLEEDFDEEEYDDLTVNEDEVIDSSDVPEDDFTFEDTEDHTDTDNIEESFPEQGEVEDEDYSHSEYREKKRMHPLLIAFLVLLCLAALAGIVYFVYDSFTGEATPVLQAEKEEQKNSGSVNTDAVETRADTADKTAVSVESSPAPSKSPQTASAVSEAKKVGNSDKGVWYRIRWGDTLWGISYSFYSSPKLYAKIAEENKIKNPDLIFAETKIFIPKE